MIYKQIEIPIHILNSIKNMQKYAKNQVAVKFPDYDLESFSLNNNVLHLNLETKKVSNRPKSYDKTKPSRVVETVFIPVEAKIQMADLLNYTANSFGVEYTKLKTKTTPITISPTIATIHLHLGMSSTNISYKLCSEP